MHPAIPANDTNARDPRAPKESSMPQPTYDLVVFGATMIAALHAVRAKTPAKLICAVPVAAPESLFKVQQYADEVVCLEAPPGFQAVSQFYRKFPQVDDDEVIALLAARPRSAAKSSQ
jgi:predicted phosphoribosyltransferase